MTVLDLLTVLQFYRVDARILIEKPEGGFIEVTNDFTEIETPQAGATLVIKAKPIDARPLTAVID